MELLITKSDLPFDESQAAKPWAEDPRRDWGYRSSGLLYAPLPSEAKYKNDHCLMPIVQAKVNNGNLSSQVAKPEPQEHVSL